MKTLLLSLFITAANGQTTLPPQLRGIGIEQRLGETLPSGIQLTDEHGRSVTIEQIAQGRPVLLALVYYRCTMLCNQILNGVVRGLRPLKLQPGRDFQVVALSIDPTETPELAAAKRDHYMHSYSHNAAEAGWHFLTAPDTSVQAVADAVGFHYRYDPATKLYLHASGVMVLTPRMQVARYFYGVEYEPKDLKLGLIEASGNRIGSRVDQILLFCYHYDPAQGKYSATVMNLVRGGGIVTVACLALMFALLWRREARAT